MAGAGFFAVVVVASGAAVAKVRDDKGSVKTSDFGGTVVTSVMLPLVTTVGLPTLSSWMTPITVEDEEPALERLNWALGATPWPRSRNRSSTPFGSAPTKLFCLDAVLKSPTSRLSVVVSVDVPPE